MWSSSPTSPPTRTWTSSAARRASSPGSPASPSTRPWPATGGTRRADLAVLSSQLDVAPATPEDDASSRELGRILERQIDALPDLYRSVFVLRDVEELTTAETAAALAITEEAVRVRLHRARHLLQNALVEGIGPASAHVFRFDGERCDRIVLGVLSHLIDLP